MSNLQLKPNGYRLSRRGFLMLTGSMASAVALAACVPAPTAAPASEGGSAAAPAAAAGELVVSIIQNIPDEAQQALTAAYKETGNHPDVNIVWELQRLGAGDYPQWLGTQVAAGNIRPDIVSGNYFPNFDGYLNFDKYRKADNPYTGRTWDADLDWNFFVARNAKGERNMLPTRAVHTMWFYNKDMFETMGVKPPTTWGEFVSACDQIATAGTVPISVNYIYQVPQWLAEIYFDQYHIDWIEKVRAQPGDWNYDPELDESFTLNPQEPNIHSQYTYNVQRLYKGLRDHELRFDTPEIADIVKNSAQIFPRHATADLFVLQDQYLPFLQQQTAIMCNGTWAIPTLLQDMASMTPERLKELKIENAEIKSFNWGTFENPPMQGDLVKSPARAVESATGEYLSVIEKTQEQTDLAVDFLLFWTCKIGYQPYLEGYIASKKFRPSGPLMVKDVQDPPEYQEMFNQVEFKGNAEVNYNGFWLGLSGGDFMKDARNMYKDALEGTITPEDFAKNLQTYLDDNFEAIVKNAGLSDADIENPARQPGS